MKKLRTGLFLIGAAFTMVSEMAGATVIGTNIISNGGAESGLSGWATTGGFTVRDSGWYSITAPQGSRFFAGSPNTTPATATQSLDISDLSVFIDAGALTADLSAWLGGWSTQNDQATVEAIFKDSGSSMLSTLTIGPVTASDRSGATGFLFLSDSVIVPASSRNIDVVITSTRSAGTWNDGYADGLSLVLNRAENIPEPATAVLMAIGFAGVGFVRKKKQA